MIAAHCLCLCVRDSAFALRLISHAHTDFAFVDRASISAQSCGELFDDAPDGLIVLAGGLRQRHLAVRLVLEAAHIELEKSRLRVGLASRSAELGVVGKVMAPLTVRVLFVASCHPRLTALCLARRIQKLVLAMETVGLF